MKKILLSSFIAIALLVSAQPVFAGTPGCEWFEKNDEINFCVGGFDSISEGQNHQLVIDCYIGCGGWTSGGSGVGLGSGQVVDFSGFEFVMGDYGFYTCLQLSGIDNAVTETVLNCIEDTNGTVDSCMPVIGGTVEEEGTNSEWCADVFIPDELLLPQIEEAVEAALGPALVPSSTPAPFVPLKVDNNTFNSFNPLITEGSAQAVALSTPGGIISRILEFAFPIAGLILFVMLVLGGFAMVSGATDKKAVETGKQQITSALVGFILLFSSFWIMRLLEMIFGIKIL